MRLDELRTKYETAWRIINNERTVREYLFRNAPEMQEMRMGEMDELLAILAWMKDALKPHCEDAPAEQRRLLDTPSRYE